MSIVLFVPAHVTTRLLDPTGSVAWEVLVGSPDAGGVAHDLRVVVEIFTVTDAEPEGAEIPSEFRMANIFPNLMSGNGMLEVHLPSETAVSVRLFDTLGRQVERVAQTHLAAGIHRLPVDVRAAAGVYLLVVETSSGREFQQIVITR